MAISQALAVPADVYVKQEGVTLFNQLAQKIAMDTVSLEQYYAWLDETIESIGRRVRGARIVEKPTARSAPPLNIAVYYDTSDYRVLPTGALLRTSCNIVTHAFCAYKAVEDGHGVRPDFRYVFDGVEKKTIQQAPTSGAAVSIVKQLLARNDIRHPGKYLEEAVGVSPTSLFPALALDSHRYTFFAWIDGRDALRCSIDQYAVYDLRVPNGEQRKIPVSEVELAIYPHLPPESARDPRTVELIQVLGDSLIATFGVQVTKFIKYQRAAHALGIWDQNSGVIARTLSPGISEPI